MARRERQRIRGWRKIAAATWGHPNDPHIYGDLDLDAGPMLAFIDEVRAATGVRISVTHLAGKAVAHALAANPDLNVRLHRGHFVRRETVDVFFIVSAEQGQELSGVKVERVDERSVVDVARQLQRRATSIRDGQDPEFGRTKKALERIPPRPLGLIMRLVAWLTVDLDLDLRRIGLPAPQAFGSTMISSVGMFGVQHAYAPLSPYYRVPFLVLVGEVAKRPVVVDDRVEARPMVTLAATIDHRYLDGFHAARLARAVREYCSDPKRFEPELS